jgi:hypothetical protein
VPLVRIQHPGNKHRKVRRGTACNKHYYLQARTKAYIYASSSNVIRMNKKHMVGIMAALLVVTIFASGCTSPTTTSSSPSPASSPSGSISPSASQSERSSFSFQQRSDNSNVGQGVSSPSVGNRYCVYYATARNVNAPSSGINVRSFKLVDTAGKSYDVDYATSLSTGAFQGASNWKPGDSVSGIIAFLIPLTAQPKSIVYNDFVLNTTIAV